MNAAPTRRVSPTLEQTSGLSVRSPRLLIAAPARSGTYAPAPVPSVIAYRVDTGEHRQTGVVVEVAVEDYLRNRIRRHEATHPAQERELDELTETTGREHVPVTLTYPTRRSLRSVLDEITSTTPELVHTCDSGVTHTVWQRQEPEWIRSVHHELDRVGALYIADGHHRMAAATRRASRHDAAIGPRAFTLAALFPSDEMRVLGYHRGLARPPMHHSDVLTALAKQSAISSVDECSPTEFPRPEPGVMLMCLDGTWYRLALRTWHGSDDVRSSLDVVALDEVVLPQAFGSHAQDAVATRFSDDPREVARWCAERDVIGFLPHPPDVEQIMSVSDADQIMPPKSTWFDPKTDTDLFIRELAREL